MDALGLGASIVWLDGWQKKSHSRNLTNDIIYALSISFSVLELTKMVEWLCSLVSLSSPGSVFVSWCPPLESILCRQPQGEWGGGIAERQCPLAPYQREAGLSEKKLVRFRRICSVELPQVASQCYNINLIVFDHPGPFWAHRNQFGQSERLTQ